jgi:transposase
MIEPPTNTRVWIAAGVTDLRRGFTGLSALVQTKLEQSPFSGQVFVFRGRRGDLIKLLWYDGDGLCLFSAAGARTFRVAAGNERHGFVDAGAVIDAAGRH